MHADNKCERKDLVPTAGLAQGMMGSAAVKAEASGLGAPQDASELICKAPQESAPPQTLERQGSCPVNGSSPTTLSSGSMSARSHLSVRGRVLAVLVLLCLPVPEALDLLAWDLGHAYILIKSLMEKRSCTL